MTRTETATLALIGALMLGAGTASAQQATGGAAAGENAPYARQVEGSFADVAFAVEQAITNEGLVIDSTNHVGAMLSRTKGDVGGAKDLYTEADTYNFCSAIQSRQAMEADIANIQFCPYSIFIYETVAEPGNIVVGHRVYPGEAMAGVNELLTRIVDTAAE
ncbi:MAG TPA: DUF302 domain-containing protein [Paracoccus sp. (in: a-proteobacteria)]|nr:DUF302 domain-containing protein [Paracoccus sp. (in: a-proteobacteria)]